MIHASKPLYTVHYLHPEKKFGIFEDGWFIEYAATYEEAEARIKELEKKEQQT